MNTEKMREEFEMWWSDNMNTQEMDLHRCNFPMQKPDFVQPYDCHETQRSWLSWAGSRASIEVELPNSDKMQDSELYHYSEVKDVIESLGLRMK